MLSALSLGNFKIFGEVQRIPLAPITVVVGPNNTGKSCLMSVGEFVREGVSAVGAEQWNEGPTLRAMHRPTTALDHLTLGWEGDLDGTPFSYLTSIERTGKVVRRRSERLQVGDEVLLDQVKVPPVRAGGPLDVIRHSQQLQRPFAGAVLGLASNETAREHALAAKVLAPLQQSRLVKLSLDAMRLDAQSTATPALSYDGLNLGAVLSFWRGFEPERSEALDAFLSDCLPEVKRALVRPVDASGTLRVWIEQKDGERFEPDEISDGVLCFLALAMHAIDAPPNSVVFLEEPERSIHPLRLRQLVDLLRRAVNERRCQFVIATHSPTLLNEFRDEPEAIVVLRRGEHGSVASTLRDDPLLMRALDEHDATPGELMVNGYLPGAPP